MVVSLASPIQVELHLETVFEQTEDVSVNTLPTPTQWQSWVSTWLGSLADNLPKTEAYELTLRLTDDQEIQKLNSHYRQQDKPTDILAFAALEAELPKDQAIAEGEPLYLGDLVLSLPTAYRQAQESCHSLTTELAWLTAHGLLHLLGWDHPDEDSLQAMLTEQAHLLNQIGLTASLEF